MEKGSLPIWSPYLLVFYCSSCHRAEQTLSEQTREEVGVEAPVRLLGNTAKL